MSLLVVRSHFWPQLIDIIASFGLLPVLAPLSSQASASPLSQSLYYYYIYFLMGDLERACADRQGPKVMKWETKTTFFVLIINDLDAFG